MSTSGVGLVKSFLGKLPSVVTKDSAINSLDQLESNVKKLKIGYTTFKKCIDKYGIKSDVGSEINSRVMALYKKRTVIDVIGLGIRSMDSRINELSSVVSTKLDEDNPTNVMTYDKANILKLIEVHLSWVDYAVSVMRYIAANEVAEARSEEPPYSKHFANKITTGLGNWIIHSSIVIDSPNLEKAIDEASSVTVVSKDSDHNSLDKSKDPLRMGFLGTYFNIIYMAYDLAADFEIWYRDYLKNSVEDIISHTEYLESLSKEQNTTRYEDQIKKNNDKIKVLEYKIKQIEEEA